MSSVQKKKSEILRDEIQKFKIFLFGKDVLSIIEKYYFEGFDEWSSQIKNLNKD